LIVTSLCSLLFVTAPIRGDTIDSTKDTTAQVGFRQGPVRPNTPNVPGDSVHSNNQVTSTSTNLPTNTNKYLPQTDETDSPWLPIIGLSLMGTLSIAYVTKLKTTYKL